MWTKKWTGRTRKPAIGDEDGRGGKHEPFKKEEAMQVTKKDIKELNSDVDKLSQSIDDKLKDIADRQKDLKKAGVKKVPPCEKDLLDILNQVEKLEKQVEKMDDLTQKPEYEKASKVLLNLEKELKAASKDADKQMDEKEEELPG
jgi:septation ring formation regulator EzrA